MFIIQLAYLLVMIRKLLLEILHIPMAVVATVDRSVATATVTPLLLLVRSFEEFMDTTFSVAFPLLLCVTLMFTLHLLTLSLSLSLSLSLEWSAA